MKVYFGIGSNLGDREVNIEDALNRIEERIGPVTKSSSFYETEPWGFTSDEQFLNIAAEADTQLSILMNCWKPIQKIETSLGRIRERKFSILRGLSILIFFFMMIS